MAPLKGDSGPEPALGLDELVRKHRLPLRRAFEEGGRTYGPLPLGFDAFSCAVMARTLRRLHSRGLVASKDRIAEVLSKAAGADLFLAVACEEQAPGAWDVFLKHFIPLLENVARRHGASGFEAEEIARNLPGELIASPGAGGARSRLATYDGSGSLRSWLKVIVLRRLADRARIRKTVSLNGTQGREKDRALEQRWVTSSIVDPLESILKAQTAERLKEALRSAWKDLTPREGLALLFRFRDGLRQREIASIMGMGEPRISRLLKRSVRKLHIRIQKQYLKDASELLEDWGRLWETLRNAAGEFLQKTAAPHDPKEGVTHET